MIKYPKDLLEVTKNMFEDKERLLIFIASSELVMYHFSLGMYLRNHYKLWNPKEMHKYVDKDSWYSADEVSYKFVEKVQKMLKESL